MSKNTTLLMCGIALSTVLVSISPGSAADVAETPQSQCMTISENRCFAKGGVGIVNQNLYINVSSPGNALLLTGGKRWEGQPRESLQLVYVWKDSVYDGTNLPGGFTLAESTVISFELTKVYFYDHVNGKGGYYDRRSDGAHERP